MSPRYKTVLSILIAALAVCSATWILGWRAVEWSEKGWIGVSIMPPQPEMKTAPPQFLAERGMIPGGVFMIVPASPADRSGLIQGDLIRRINGIAFEETEKLIELDAQLSRGDTIEYEIERKGERKLITSRLESPFRSPLISWAAATGALVAFVFLLIGGFVFLRRPGDRSAQIFFTITVVAAISLGASGILSLESGTMRGVTAQSNSLTVPFLALVGFLLAPLLVHLSLIYPRPRPVFRAIPEILRWVYSAPVWFLGTLTAIVVIKGALDGDLNTTIQGRMIETTLSQQTQLIIFVVLGLLALATGIGWIRALKRWGRSWFLFSRSPLLILATWLFVIAPVVEVGAAVGRELDLVLGWVEAIAEISLVVIPLLSFPILAIVACINFFRSYRESDVEEKRQLRWPLWGMIVGIGGRMTLVLGMGIYTFYSFIRWGDVFPSTSLSIGTDAAAKLLYVLVPISFAFAILKYRLMEIDIIIRKTIVYSVVSGVIAFVWIALAGGVGTLIVETTQVESQTVTVAATLLAGLIFVPLRNRLQKLVDHRYRKSEQSLTTVERGIGRDIANAADLPTLLRSTAEDVQQALETSTVVFLLPDPAGASRIGASVGLPDSDAGGSLRFNEFDAIDRVTSIEEMDLGEVTASTLRRFRAHSVVPLRRKGSLVGLLLLGRRIDRKELSLVEIDFLASIADQIAVGIDNLLRENDSEEFEQARDIQRALLPAVLPSIPGIRITGSWEPAKAVGGDYYDVIQIDENSVGVCIADVAGKGMPAALLMSNLQAVVRAMAARDASPSALCTRVRNIITTNLSGGKFITFFYCLIDHQNGQLRWANAGHLVPILLSADGSALRLDEGGPAFARLFNALPYEEGSIEYAPGDRLLLFTDGVTEAENAAGEQLGEERLIEFLMSHDDIPHAEEMQRAVLDLVDHHSSGNYADDVTLVAVSWD